MKQELYNRIERYLRNEMPIPERNRFESDLKSNRELAKQFAEQEMDYKLMEALAEKDLRSKLIKWQAEDEKVEFNNKPTKIFRLSRRLISLAASFLVLIVAGTWFYNTNIKTQHSNILNYYDFEELYILENKSVDNQDATKDEVQIKEAINLIQADKLNQATDLLQKIEANSRTTLLKGHLLLKKGITEKNKQSFDKAIQTTLPLSQNKNIAIKEEADWVLLICYSQNDIYKIKFESILDTILKNSDHAFYGKAKKIKVAIKN